MLKKRSFQKIFSSALCIATLLTLPSCSNGKSETSILKEDSYDALIEEANKQTVQETTPTAPTDTVIESQTNSDAPIETISSEGYLGPEITSDSSSVLSDSNGNEYYVATLQNEEKDITISANAPLTVPRTNNLSIYSVKQAPFTQEFVNKVRSALMGDIPIYDGVFLELESDVNYLLKSINETGSQSLIAEYQKQIDELLPQEYRDLSDFELKSFPSDGLLTKTQDSYAVKPYYKWQYEMYPEGEYLFAINDAADGVYHSLTVYNDPNRSNKLVYTKNNLLYIDISGNYITKETFEKNYGDINNYIGNSQYVAEPKYYVDYSGSLSYTQPIYVPEDKDGLSISEEEAISLADNFLQSIGITDFGCYQKEKSNPDLCRCLGAEIVIYRDVYKLTYYRFIDGIPLTPSSGNKHNEYVSGPEGAMYTKKYWNSESIIIYVSDDGIVQFVYNSPIEITDTISTNISVKPFDEIKELFESVILSDANRTKNESCIYNIKSVSLSYSRISEGISNYETGLIVPMWDFSGTTVRNVAYYDNPLTSIYAPLLAINAVDGSVIHPQYGYN